MALKPLLTSLKDPILTSEKSCLIYKIPSNDCEFSYIGQAKIQKIQGTAGKVRRILNEAGVKVAMRSVRTIGQILPSPKDPQNPEEKSCVVYQVPCSDCNFVYIGQTKRELKSRLAEHNLVI